MRFSTILPLALAAAPAVVSAAGSLGFALGDKKSDGSCKFQTDWAADFKAISAVQTSKIVRTYSASECNTAKEILPAAKAAGFKVILGVWPDYDESLAKDEAALVKYTPDFKDQVYAITVGSETMYRGNFTGPELLQRINKIKKAVPGFKVGTADSWNKFQDGTADALITGGVDILLTNGFSYWQGQADNNATASFFDDIMQAFGHIQEVSGKVEGGIELWVGETGWPTGGSKYQAAVPSLDGAKNYWKKAICGITAWGVNVFYFEAFDEPWKPKSTGQDGSVADETHWGAWNADRTPKDEAADDLDIVCARLKTPANISVSSSPSSSRAAPVASIDFIPATPESDDSVPGSPAFSSSSTAEGGSSPILPPLPQPTINGRSLNLSNTPPSESRTESSRYFTSWGSPYQEPADPVPARPHRGTLSSDTSEESPLRRLDFHSLHLRPPPSFLRSTTEPVAAPVSASVLVNRARRPTRGLTEDWIRQHTAAEDQEIERLAWLSDSNKSDEKGYSSLSSSEAEDQLEEYEFGQKTPTLKSFLERRYSKHGNRRHLRGPSAETIRPRDVPKYKAPTSMTSSASYETAEQSVAGLAAQDDVFAASHDTPPPTIDKPLPTPPADTADKRSSTSSNWRAAALPMASDVALEDLAPKPTPSPNPEPPRLKTKVPWGKKNISILLPLDEDRGKEGKGPKPLTEKDVVSMLRDWEQLGYNVTGFNLDADSEPHEAVSQGQSRGMWPDATEIRLERDARNYRISIPDRRHWDAYVEELQEAKLRALGVSLGDEDPVPIASPAPSLSRQASAQYGLPFQPPLPTSSAASSHGTQPSKLFSPPLLPATGQSSFVGSTASTSSGHGHVLGKFHNPRQSISFSAGEHPFASPYGGSQQQSPVPWSPQQMLYQGMHRGGSPSVHNFGGFTSPGSPLPQDGYFPNETTPVAAQPQRQFSGQMPFHQVQQSISRQSPRLQELQPEGEKSASNTPEASQPGHRLNLSDSLQKEIEDAEYHLEEQFERQLDHDDYSPHSERAPVSPPQEEQQEKRKPAFAGLSASKYADDDGPVLYHPQPHSRGHSLSQRPYDGESASPALASESAKLDTSESSANPSAPGTPKLANSSIHQKSQSIATNPWADSEPTSGAEKGSGGHVSKASMSKLNVAAPEFKFNASTSSEFKFNPASATEFKFNPAASSEFKFNPASTFTPSKPIFAAPQPEVSAFNTTFQPISPSPASPPVTFGGSKINVNAAPFTPGQSEFSFSSSGPMFRADAPEFTPLASYMSDSAGSSAETPANLRSSIFGNISMSLSDIVKQPKKSKAIPIIRPDTSSGGSGDEDGGVEGEDGRITQGDGRFKRSKADAGDGDSVPLFAQPTMPLQETTREQSPPKDATPVTAKPIDKENASPSDQEQEPLRIVPVPERALQNQSRSRFEDSPDYEGKAWAPYEWQQQQDAVDFSRSNPHSIGSAPFKVLDQNVAAEEPDAPAPSTESNDHKKHKKNSLSALAKPFQFGANWFGTESAEPDAPAPTNPFTYVAPEPAKAAPATTAPRKGLASSRYADPTPSPPPQRSEVAAEVQASEISAFEDPAPQSPAAYDGTSYIATPPREASFEEIDDIMRHINEADSTMGAVRHDTESLQRPVSSEQTLQMPHSESSPIRLHPQNLMRSDAPSPSPRRFQALPGGHGQRVFSRVEDDPFVSHSPIARAFETSPVHHLNGDESVEPSDWDSVLDRDDESKFNARSQFFDSHVNDIVGGILAEKLGPMEQALQVIQLSLATMRPTSSRRARRSMSAEFQESDADDEDDDEGHRRSLSPRKDRKLDKMRSMIAEAFAEHHSVKPAENTQDASEILRALKELQGQVGQPAVQGEDLRSVVESALESRMPVAPVIDDAAQAKIAELEAKVSEMTAKITSADDKMELEVTNRRAAEDRLAEVQRLLRISSEEEVRLRESLEERDKKVKTLEDTRAKNAMRSNVLEASSQNSQKNHSDLTNRIAVLEKDLADARQQGRQWEFETQKANEAAKASKDDAEKVTAESMALGRAVDGLKLQMQESLRVRENFRHKLGNLQDDMAKAAQDVSQENAQRAKKEQALIARQEVLDARLQAEARTRERLEKEIERLEAGEREGIRAVNDSKRLDILVVNLENELNAAEKNVLRHKREFEEARESGLSEVQRTRNYMQAEIESANNQVNIVRQDLEDQLARVRADLDHVKLDADTARERHDMLLEEATESKAKELNELTRRHQDQIEDIQTQHERQLSNALEDAQRSEQHLLERLSLSSAKTEHLQDRVAHIEEKLEVTKSAALAAAQAARTVKDPSQTSALTTNLPEKVSPQALRESIMVLQEQLQNREQTIESLEQQLAGVDLDAPTKITKRDDEIMWLRELLAVRVGDLQDIINTIGEPDFDPETVREAAIRLQANLKMEEQERERALAGGSAINLPNIASSIREAASPRVAQVVGPMAAAWGSWRKTREGLQPGRASPAATVASGAQSFLSGLMTPPAAAPRQTAPPQQAQPSAFQNTGRRLAAAQMARERASPRKEIAKGKARAASADGPPATPPMMHRSNYDSDARAEDYSDAGFYDDDESTVDETMFGANLGR
ncbi:hypothetical protein V492_05873 [Pseudogymnoascus sp. VKM F-4246]|nr:hypothetical protein V492_05873 [Pseudogymnoascus sp. VKM F-4246]